MVIGCARVTLYFRACGVRPFVGHAISQTSGRILPKRVTCLPRVVRVCVINFFSLSVHHAILIGQSDLDQLLGQRQVIKFDNSRILQYKYSVII